MYTTANWSQAFHGNLSAKQHQANNDWLKMMLQLLGQRVGGFLVVSDLGKTFEIVDQNTVKLVK